MRSGTRYFSAGIFWKNQRRFWPLWAIYLAAWLLILPLPMLRRLSVPGLDRADAMAQILAAALQSGAILTFLMGIAAAMAMWGFLYNPRSSTMMGALPVRREGLFLTGAASALLPMLAIHVVTFLAALAAGSGCLRAGELLTWLAFVSMELILFFGIATFCAMLTGHIVVLPVLYGVLNFTAVVMELVVCRLLQNFVYGLPAGCRDVLMPLSPLVQILSSVGVDRHWNENGILESVTINGGWPLVIYCGVGLLLLAGAFALLRRRRLETAGDVVAVRVLRPLFRYGFAVGCALVLGWLFYYVICSGTEIGGRSAAAVTTVLILAGCFIGYFAASMLLDKSFRVFSRWRGFAVTALVLVLLCAGCEFDLTGYERHVPDPAQVQRLTMGSQAVLCAGENLESASALHREIVASKPDFDGYAGETRTIQFTYEMTDGSVVSRRYTVPLNYSSPLDAQNESIRMYQALLNTQEAILSRVLPEVDVTARNVSWAAVSWMETPDSWEELPLTGAEAESLWTEGILPDLEAGGIGQYWLLDEGGLDNEMRCQLYLELTDRNSLERANGTMLDYAWNDTVDITLTLAAVHTRAWLAEHGVDPLTERAYRALADASVDTPVPSTEAVTSIGS